MKRIIIVICVLAVCCQCAGNRKLANQESSRTRKYTFAGVNPEKATLDTLLHCRDIAALCDTLRSWIIYDSSAHCAKAIQDTITYSTPNGIIRATSNVHLTYLLLDTNANYIQILINDELPPGFNAVYFDGNIILNEYFAWLPPIHVGAYCR